MNFLANIGRVFASKLTPPPILVEQFVSANLKRIVQDMHEDTETRDQLYVIITKVLERPTENLPIVELACSDWISALGALGECLKNVHLKAIGVLKDVRFKNFVMGIIDEKRLPTEREINLLVAVVRDTVVKQGLPNETLDGLTFQHKSTADGLTAKRKLTDVGDTPTTKRVKIDEVEHIVDDENEEPVEPELYDDTVGLEAIYEDEEELNCGDEGDEDSEGIESLEDEEAEDEEVEVSLSPKEIKSKNRNKKR